MSEDSPFAPVGTAKKPAASPAVVRGFRTAGGTPVSPAFSFPARVADALIWIYQKTVSPALFALNPNCGCRFAPTCSQYARQALAEHGLVNGFFLTLCRLIKCGPWHRGGVDCVPVRHRPICTKVSAS